MQPLVFIAVYILQGRLARRGHLRRRIAVTLSIFIFSSWFLAHFVENCEGHLSRPFLSTGDNFSKSYDENQIWSKRQRAGHADPWGLELYVLIYANESTDNI